MRPVERGAEPTGVVVEEYGGWRPHLIERVGCYCSYCEMRLTSPVPVEHKIPKRDVPAGELQWTNVLLSCYSCNSSKPKKNVVESEYFWPDTDNTFRAFRYHPTGEIEVDRLPSDAERDTARRTLHLYGLDKHPGGPDLPTSISDRRWLLRHEAWNKADRARDLLGRNDTPEQRETILALALETGFFSVWMAVFQADPLMRRLFIAGFIGTAQDCFDAFGQPLPRRGGRI